MPDTKQYIDRHAPESWAGDLLAELLDAPAYDDTPTPDVGPDRLGPAHPTPPCDDPWAVDVSTEEPW
jgi:hypothetical protein